MTTVPARPRAPHVAVIGDGDPRGPEAHRILEWAEEVCQRMVHVERTVDGALLLDADPAWVGAINTVLVMKGVRVNELRKETM